MSKRWLLLGLFLLGGSACGDLTGTDPVGAEIPSGAPPVITRLDPESAAAGSELNVFGVGFALHAPLNVLSIDSYSLLASEYTLLAAPADGEVEQLTFTVPDDIAAGEYAVLLIVDGSPSNGDLSFTVTP